MNQLWRCKEVVNWQTTSIQDSTTTTATPNRPVDYQPAAGTSCRWKRMSSVEVVNAWTMPRRMALLFYLSSCCDDGRRWGCAKYCRPDCRPWLIRGALLCHAGKQKSRAPRFKVTPILAFLSLHCTGSKMSESGRVWMQILCQSKLKDPPVMPCQIIGRMEQGRTHIGFFENWFACSNCFQTKFMWTSLLSEASSVAECMSQVLS